MPISFSKTEQRFTLTTKHTAYVLGIVGDRYLRHIYYGKKKRDIPTPPLHTRSFAPYQPEFKANFSPDTIPTEYSFFGSGDFRTSALRLCGEDGTGVTDFVYKSHKVIKGRPAIDGIPFARADEDTKTLEIKLFDSVTRCTLKLYYTVFFNEDVISRYMVLENGGKSEVQIEKCMSFAVDFLHSDFDMVSFWGSHLHECTYQRHRLHHGLQSITSRRGSTSHHYNPFFALCSHDADEESGEVYGFNFVYSGSFLNEVEVDQLGYTRVAVGLGSECFGYTLSPGESFSSPEAILTYSPSGFGNMARNLHDFTRAHILPPEAVTAPHPVVLNTWEAVYFNIDQQLIIDFAEESAKVGFDMLVMDDGWFGERHDDRAGLGDWFTNARKFPDGLRAFVDKVKAKGIKFGIWVEPEMVNPDSDLYRAHPDWCLRVPGRTPSLSRDQLVLDMSNDEVISYLIESFDKTFDGVSIDYFKWDYNRHMSDVGSSALPAERQKEVFFRFMKGTYRLLEHFRTKYPNAIIETCSGGGGRYDLAMMTYGVQIWTSDNTNPYDRTDIQYSALLAYPAATMSCHVSNPRENMKSLDYRYKVAVGGMLGYELNILNMPDDFKAVMADQVKEYKSFEHLMRLGDYYPLASPVRYDYSAYYYTSRSHDEILLTVIEKKDCRSKQTKRLKIKTAASEAVYTDLRTGKKYSGDELRRGLNIPLSGEPDSAYLFHFKKD